MTFRSLFVVVGMMLHQLPAMACDACGCASTMGSAGMLSALKQNTLSLSLSRASFASLNPSLQLVDKFQTLEWSLRYHIVQRWKILVHQPFQLNLRKVNNESQSLNGLSDGRILVNYTVIKRQDSISVRNTHFEVGAGISLPTGKYDQNIHNQNLPENFNLGRGAVCYLLQTNFLTSGKYVGFFAQSLAQMPTNSVDGYHFGNQLQLTSSVFLKLAQYSSLRLIPSLGFIGEYFSHDQYANGKTVHGTGGSGILPAIGITARSRKLLLSMQVAAPLVGVYSDSEVEALPRSSCQLSFLF